MPSSTSPAHSPVPTVRQLALDTIETLCLATAEAEPPNRRSTAAGLKQVLDTAIGGFFRLLVGELALRMERSPQDVGFCAALPALPDLATGPLRHAQETARSLAATAREPADLITSLYECCLGWQLESSGTPRVALSPTRDRRKNQGCFYTPRSAARITVEAALQPLRIASPHSPLPHLLDPAMGTGTFLVEAVHQVAGVTAAAPATVAETCLYGFDLDTMAVELAVLSLWLQYGARPEVLRRNLLAGNLLGEQMPAVPARIDVVLGNPPWGAVYSSDDRRRLRQRFPGSTAGTFDSFKLFLDLASRMTSGTVGMIVPQAVLAQTGHRDIRLSLLSRLDPYAAIRLPDSLFAGAVAPSCALVFGPRPGPAMVNCVGVDTIQARVPANLWRTGTFHLQGHTALDLLRRLQEHHPTLGTLSPLIQVRDAGINYNHASVAQRVLYCGDNPQDPRDEPRYRGRNFDRYTPVSRGGWLRHNATALLEPGETLNLHWKLYRLPEKIVLRQTADRIVASLDRSCMALGRSVLAVTARGDVSLPAVLACLNSRLLTALYRSLAGETERVLPQVKVARLHALPLPAVCALPLSTYTAARAGGVSMQSTSTMLDWCERRPDRIWACLDALARRLLFLGGKHSSTDSTIDCLVYALYGLSEQDITSVLIEE